MFLFSTSKAQAWGRTGHRVVGEIAYLHLTKASKKEIHKILKGYPLAQLTLYPDFVRGNEDWSRPYTPWHYINIEEGKSFNPKKRNKKGDVIHGIEFFRKKLTNKKSTQQEKWRALAFVSHFVGDLHQPLHTGYAKDRGGNDIQLKWFGKHSNLHRVWDSDLINMQKLSYTEYTKLINRPTKKQLQKWSKIEPVTWLKESRAYLKKIYAPKYLKNNKESFCFPFCRKKKKPKYWEYKYEHEHISFFKQALTASRNPFSSPTQQRLRKLATSLFHKKPVCIT